MRSMMMQDEPSDGTTHSTAADAGPLDRAATDADIRKGAAELEKLRRFPPVGGRHRRLARTAQYSIRGVRQLRHSLAGLSRCDERTAREKEIRHLRSARQ